MCFLANCYYNNAHVLYLDVVQFSQLSNLLSCLNKHILNTSVLPMFLGDPEWFCDTLNSSCGTVSNTFITVFITPQMSLLTVPMHTL